MEINILREIMTVLSFLAFLAIVAYAYNPGNRERFEDAAKLPVGDDRPFGQGEEGR